MIGKPEGAMTHEPRHPPEEPFHFRQLKTLSHRMKPDEKSNVTLRPITDPIAKRISPA